MATARAILERGDVVLMFPEGTRIRPGLARPPRSAGSGASRSRPARRSSRSPCIGTEAVRRGWRIRPHKVRIRAGRALTFPKVEQPSPRSPARSPTASGPASSCSGSGSAACRGCTARPSSAPARGAPASPSRSRARASRSTSAPRAPSRRRASARTARNDADLPGVALPDGINALPAARIELEHHDLVVLAVPAHALPAAVGAYGGRIPARAGVLVLARGLVPPADALPTAYVAERVRARAVGCLAGPGADGALAEGAAIVAAAEDEPFLAQVAAVLRAAGLDVTTTREVAAVQLAGTPASARGPRRRGAGTSAPTHRPGRSRAA